MSKNILCVGKLKEILKDVPDDLPVVVYNKIVEIDEPHVTTAYNSKVHNHEVPFKIFLIRKPDKKTVLT